MSFETKCTSTFNHYSMFPSPRILLRYPGGSINLNNNNNYSIFSLKITLMLDYNSSFIFF